MGRGAGNLPLYYEGEWDATLAYLPRQVVTLTGAAYLAIARSSGISPGSDPTIWLPLGGDSEHNGTGTDSTAVGTAAVASGPSSTAVGDDSYAPGDSTVAVGFNTAARPVGAVAVGYNAGVTILATYGIAVGYQAGASASGAIALGREALAQATGSITFGTGNNNMAHTAMLFANDLRLRTQTSGATRYILSSPSAYEYAITVDDAGVLSVVAA